MAVTFTKLMSNFADILKKIYKIGWGLHLNPSINKIHNCWKKSKCFKTGV